MITLKIYIPHQEDATAIGFCSELQHKKQTTPPPPPTASPFRLIRGGKLIDNPEESNQPYLKLVNDEPSGKAILNYALGLIEKAARTHDGSIKERDINRAMGRLQKIEL